MRVTQENFLYKSLQQVRTPSPTTVFRAKMMIEDLPLWSTNIKVWILCGFIGFKSYWRIFALLFIPVLMNLLQITYAVKNSEHFEKCVLSTFMMGINFNSIIRILAVVVQQKEFLEFIEDIEKWHQEAERRNDIAALKVLDAITSKANKVSKFNSIMGTSAAFMTIIGPLLLRNRELPFPVWLPIVDVNETPYYEITYAVELTISMPFILVAYVPYTNLFLTWLIFGIGVLQILQAKLENLMESSKTANEIDEELSYCIEYHIRIIRYKDKLSSMLSLTNFLEFIMFSMMLCALFYFMLVIDSFMLQAIAAVYIVCIFYVVLIFYWHTNEFTCGSLKIADAAYNSDWTSGTLKQKRSILLMILRGQNALEISAGGMHPMTLETFKSLLNASYSYFTVLSGMRQ